MILPAAEWDVALQELIAWLRFASVSADPAYRHDVLACAAYTADLMAHYGLSVTRVETPGNPVIIGTWHGAPQAPTVLIYGHYDVQPPDPVALWHHGPFEPVIQDGQLIARGASDNKGQIFCHLKAIEYGLRTTGTLPVNVTVIIEGEEETGSVHLPDVLRSYRDTLTADIALVSDTPMLAENRPSLCTSLRGLVYIELTLTTLSGDLHSGQHGGAVPNAIGALVTLLSQFKDSHQRVTIPGFYEGVRPIRAERSAEIAALGFNADTYAASIGARELLGERGFHPYEQRWYRPTFDINGLWGGYTLEGEKTVIPAQAHAKVSMRLVADQDPDTIIASFGRAIEAMTPSYCQVSWHVCSKAHPAVVDPHHPAVTAAMTGLQQAFGVTPVFQGEGGTIPIVAEFKRLLGLDTVLMGLNLPEDRIHAPNEQMSLANIQRGIAASMGFLEAYGKTPD
ncbi:dipeptidase [bacterium]|nr:dipeptidase [bacterium]